MLWLVTKKSSRRPISHHPSVFQTKIKRHHPINVRVKRHSSYHNNRSFPLCFLFSCTNIFINIYWSMNRDQMSSTTPFSRFYLPLSIDLWMIERATRFFAAILMNQGERGGEGVRADAMLIIGYFNARETWISWSTGYSDLLDFDFQIWLAMRVVALIRWGIAQSRFHLSRMDYVGISSGGKDSTYNMIQCVRDGHELVALANLHPKKDIGMDTTDHGGWWRVNSL